MNGIHSCNYYCEKPACIKAQRDEMRGWFFDTQTVAALQQRIAALERECEKHKNAVLVYNEDCIAAEAALQKLAASEPVAWAYIHAGECEEIGWGLPPDAVENEATLLYAAPPRTFDDGLEAELAAAKRRIASIERDLKYATMSAGEGGRDGE